jgi:hypothetical protein
MKIDRRKFLKWTGYMVAVAAVAPTEILKEKASEQFTLADLRKAKEFAAKHHMVEPYAAFVHPNQWVEMQSAEGTRIFRNALFNGHIGYYEGVKVYVGK